jgi:hypothetical protein
MKKLAVCLLISLSCIYAFATVEDWNVNKSTHFIVYYRDGFDDFAEKVIDKAEKLYNQIADYLGFRRYNFWLWDDRAKIFIYQDAAQYRLATGQPDWSLGCVSMKEKVISTYPFAGNFLDTVMPHEMGHIIFREFVGFDNPHVPLWLDEGVAGYQEPLRRFSTGRIVRVALREGKFIDIKELGRFNPHACSDAKLVDIFYAEAISIVDYLIKNFGRDKFVRFCQELRDGTTLEQSLRRVYNFNSLKELSEFWLKYLKR